MTRLLLLRHAESVWNAQGLWQGMADPPLSDCGERQAQLAGQLLVAEGITAVASSDLQRARDTAAAIATGLGCRSPLVIDAGLREYDVGRWSGLTRDQIEAAWPGAIDDWRNGRLAATPGGEARVGFVARITAAVTGLAAVRPTDTILVITHGGVISALDRRLAVPHRRTPNLGGRWFEAGPEGLWAGHQVSLLEEEGEGVSVPGAR